MGFLSGSVTFDRFWVVSDPTPPFGPEHLEILERMAIGQFETSNLDQPNVGFVAGDHLLDVRFDLEKNLLVDALHFGVRIDTHQIPAAVRKAWLQIELAELTADDPGARPTKTQRQEAKDAVEARCQDEAREGRFRNMQHLPVLWDAQAGWIYIGGTSATAIELCRDLLERAFELELDRVTSGKLAIAYADETKQRAALEEIRPALFHDREAVAEVTWWNGESGNFDFLGNEFLLWLWWYWETQSDTLALLDDSEVAGMFARTLSLECPRGESGKEAITAESPVHLPEAALAIRSGKLPRKAGLSLVRYGDQYDLALQAESFAVNGARIRPADPGDRENEREDRVNNVRGLTETLDLLFQTFCQRRLGDAWQSDLKQMRRWLSLESRAARKPAA